MTTPSADALLAKGRRLYARCLARDDRACVLAFIDHQAAEGGTRLDVLHDYLAWLDEQSEALAAAGDNSTARAHTDALRATIRRRLRISALS